MITKMELKNQVVIPVRDGYTATLVTDHEEHYTVTIRKDPQPPKYYQIGNIFQHPDGSYYILAQVEGGKVSLISLTDGNRWCFSAVVLNAYKITEDEVRRTMGSIPGKFQLVEGARATVTHTKP